MKIEETSHVERDISTLKDRVGKLEKIIRDMKDDISQLNYLLRG
jgi:prefoldin subunit 5